jgi:signal transduction histidine kinase
MSDGVPRRRATASAFERASILVVDDRAERLLAMRAVLSELDAEIVTASSGRDALRQVLHRDFAAILLDVNMPGVDGFETAALIRQRPRSERTPILFITAYSEDTHIARGYSIGAADYIVAPVDPDVLRTKVGVFVDLYRAAQQLRTHAEAMERRATQLQLLTRWSLAINSASSGDEILQTASVAGLQILGTGACAAALLRSDGAIRGGCVAVAGGEPAVRPATPDEDALLGELCERLSQTGQVLRIDTWARRGVSADGASPPDGGSTLPDAAALRGAVESGLAARHLMATPLIGHGGRRMGIVCASIDDAQEVTEESEAFLLQLGQITATAVENLLFSQAHEANALKEEFVATLSHELRTPLTAILGWVRLLQKAPGDAEILGRGIEVIERNVRAQSKLIDDLLDISRIAAGKVRLSIQPIAVRDLLETSMEAARPMAEASGVVLALACPGDVERIPADPERLQQVVWNLLTNAIKFTPRGGRIEVEAERDAPSLVLRVRDSGKGIARDFLPHVFERFRQADSGPTRGHGGLGIGLAVVRQLVELHGGSVSADSAGPGHGAVFTVRLPLQTGARAVSAAVRREEPHREGEVAGRPPARLHGVRVLAVEDDPDARELVQEILCSAGADVRAAGSVREALAALADFPAEVLVTDIGMPDEDGWSLIAKVRARFPASALPAVALTAYAGAADRARAERAGFQGYLSKPVEPDALLASVARVARRASPGGTIHPTGLAGAAASDD